MDSITMKNSIDVILTVLDQAYRKARLLDAKCDDALMDSPPPRRIDSKLIDAILRELASDQAEGLISD